MLVDNMIKYGIIDNETDRELYIYGLRNGSFVLINILTGLLFAWYLHKMLLFLILMVCFMPLRSYCGGFHCNSRIRCYILSTVIICIVLQVQNILIKIIPCVFSLAAISGVYVWKNCLEPCESEQLEVEEITYYNTCKRKVIVKIFISVAILLVFKCEMFATSIMSSVILTAILIFLSEFRGKEHKRL